MTTYYASSKREPPLLLAQTADELIRIQMEVMSGLEWGDPISKVAPTEENREAWQECERDIVAMRTAGIMPDIPFEIGLDQPTL